MRSFRWAATVALRVALRYRRPLVQAARIGELVLITRYVPLMSVAAIRA